MAPQDAVESHDWDRIKQLASETVAAAHQSSKAHHALNQHQHESADQTD
jgi:hypothetical protein